jgi:hypothetical protein
MSGYPDDSSYPDPRDPDRGDGDSRADEKAIRAAKGSVIIPALGLILIGALTLILALLGFIQLPTLGGKFDDAIKQTQANPNLQDQQKKEQVDLLTQLRDFFAAYGAVIYGGYAVLGLVILVGGVRFMSLNNPGLVAVSAIASMLPLSLCCFLGLVFGIWALVALMSSSVKAGFAARRRAGYHPDAH